MPAKPKKVNVEKSLDELEKLVEKMEDGKLDLEESLKLFERGVTLTKDCQAALRDAEQKVTILQKNQLKDYD